MKRKMALLLCVVMLMGIISACNPGTTGPSSTKSGTSTATSFPDDYEDQFDKTIIYWNAPYERDALLRQMVDNYMEMHPDITIKCIDLGSDTSESAMFQLTDTAVASGERIDLWYDYATGVINRSMQGFNLPLNDFIAYRGDDFVADYGELWNTVAAIDGVYYGIPRGNNTFKVFYNKDMMDEKGITIPDDWTWDDFLDIARQLNDPENNFYGCFYPLTWNELNYVPAQLAGWQMARREDDGTVVPNFDHPLFRENMEMLYNMSMVEKISPDIATNRAENMHRRTHLAQKKTAMIVDGYYTFIYLQNYQFNNPAIPLDFEIGVAELPRMHESDPKEVSWVAPVGAYCLPRTGKAGLHAYDFARYMSTQCLKQQAGPPAYLGADLSISAEVINNYIDEKGVLHENIYNIDAVMKAISSPHESFLSFYKYDPKLYAQYDAILTDVYLQNYEPYMTGQIDLDTFINNLMTDGKDRFALVGQS